MSRLMRSSEPVTTRMIRAFALCLGLALMPLTGAMAQEEGASAPSETAQTGFGGAETVVAETTPATPPTAKATPVQRGMAFVRLGGPAIWAISALSVAALALILWKVWRLVLMGAWSGGRRTRAAVDLWCNGQEAPALALLEGRRSCRARLIRTAMAARQDPTLDDAGAEAETERVARKLLAQARGGLRPLELIATIAPLLGLLGTVLGMIAAFQALQQAGARADPATLAGGIWEALLTTAAGMAVAIPASMALSWFESVVDRLRLEMEDAATRIFLRPVASHDTPAQAQAAE